jgi:hypothetical protein
VENDQIVFDEEACADFIFNKLIEKGVAVQIEDIRMIMGLEYEYGENIGIYPAKNEDGEREPIEASVLITISKVGGETQLHSEVFPEEALKLLKEAIETIKTFD